MEPTRKQGGLLLLSTERTDDVSLAILDAPDVSNVVGESEKEQEVIFC